MSQLLEHLEAKVEQQAKAIADLSEISRNHAKSIKLLVEAIDAINQTLKARAEIRKLEERTRKILERKTK